jgi:hypothetical protein
VRFWQLDAKIRRLLDEANAELGRPLSESRLELVKRAAGVVVHQMESGHPITTIDAMRVRIAPLTADQPAAGRIPRRCIGNTTVRTLLDEDVQRVLSLAIKLGWLCGDFHKPTALTVFSTVAEAGKDSRALAVKGGMLPMIGVGIGSFDSFIVTDLRELVYGTHHDPNAAMHDPDDIERILELWKCESIEEMALLHFEETFELIIGRDESDRGTLARIAAPGHDRGLPIEIVVQRLPHGPYSRAMRTPAGEIMANEHPRMVGILERHDCRGVVAYKEAMSETEDAETEVIHASELLDAHAHHVQADELIQSQKERDVTVDFWNVDHYIVTGQDTAGNARRRVVRRARFDGLMTIFETVGFTDETLSGAVVLSEYASANELRRSCIEASINTRIFPGLLEANSPYVRAGMRLLAMLGSAAIVGLKRRAQATP